MEQSKERLEVLERIKEYERNGWFDRDVENDPPTRPLSPGEVDYTLSRLSSKIQTKIANLVARRHFDGLIRKGELLIDRVCGIENYRAVEGGAILTCNHFNAFDNYAVYKAIRKDLGRHDLFKVIREGNFTSFPGLYGYFFRHCNTLPLSRNLVVLKEMMRAVDCLLRRGEKILIYPEQGMWYNYPKPRPLKEGAFRFAAKAGVPVIPFFITMTETDKMDAFGFPILAYTVHIMPAIYPNASLSMRENITRMRDENYAVWKAKYEEIYKTPLVYSCESGDKA